MRAKMIGSGWHKESLRHSNARRLGRAGGTYSKGQKVYGRGLLSNPETHYHLLYGTYKKTEKDGTIVLEEKGGRERRYDPKYLTPYRTTKQDTTNSLLKKYEKLRKERAKYPLYNTPIKYGLKQHELDVKWWGRLIKDPAKKKQFEKEAKEKLKGKKFKTALDVPRGLDIEWLYYKIEHGYTPEQYREHVLSYD